MGYFALVREGSVVNVIIAEQTFIDEVTAFDLGADLAVDVSELEFRPSTGYAYDGASFIAPPLPEEG